MTPWRIVFLAVVFATSLVMAWALSVEPPAPLALWHDVSRGFQGRSEYGASTQEASTGNFHTTPAWV